MTSVMIWLDRDGIVSLHEPEVDQPRGVPGAVNLEKAGEAVIGVP
jgi:hypothetical protein